MTATPSLLSRRANDHKAAREPQTVTPPAPAPDNTAKIAAVRSDSRRRAAAAWTASKTLLASASPKVQMLLAKALVQAPTQVMADALRSVARLAYYTKAAEKFAAETGRDLNEFVEDESVMTKLKNEVINENKGDVSKAAAQAAPAVPKKADEPKKEDESLPPAPPATEDPAAAPAPSDVPAAASPAPEDVPPLPPPGDMGDGGMGVDDPSAANTVGDQAVEGDLLDKIQQAESSIEDVQSQIEEAGDEALDLASIFNPEVQADKAQNLTNEGEPVEGDMEGMEGADDFSPTDLEGMQDAADGDPTGASFFKGASTADPMAVFFSHTAAEVDVPEGEMAAYFDSDLREDNRDAESDVDDLFGEILKDYEQPTMKQKRDTEPNLEAPEAPQKKAAAAPAPKKSSVRTVGSPTIPQFSEGNIEKALFRSEF